MVGKLDKFVKLGLGQYEFIGVLEEKVFRIFCV